MRNVESGFSPESDVDPQESSEQEELTLQQQPDFETSIDREAYENFADYTRASGIINKVDQFEDNNRLIPRTDRTELNQIIEDAKKLPAFTRYEAQAIKYSTLDNLLSAFDEQTSSIPNSNPDKSSIREFLYGTIKEIKLNAERYRRNVITTEKLKREMSEKEQVDDIGWKARAARHDEERRRNHNAIIDRFNILSRFPRVIKDKLGIEYDMPMLFSPNQMKDRRYIGTWAYDSATAERIIDLMSKIEKMAEPNE